MSRDEAKIAAMREFVLANGSNLQTALLIQDAMPGVRKHLVSKIATCVSEGLQEKESDWHIIENSLAKDPDRRYVYLKWGPPQWLPYGWGVSLGAESPEAGQMIFGLRAPSKKI